jgi:hypothetical protein
MRLRMRHVCRTQLAAAALADPLADLYVAGSAYAGYTGADDADIDVGREGGGAEVAVSVARIGR